MCGIAAFLSNEAWASSPDLSAFAAVEQALAANHGDWPGVMAALETLAGSFPALGSFSVHAAIAADSEARATFAATAASLARLRRQAEADIAANGRSDVVEQAKERLSDYLWQVETEVLGNLARVAALLPTPLAEAGRARHFLAWAMETVLQSLDKLEVRGRDSAGIGIALDLAGDAAVDSGLPADLKADLTRRLLAGEGADRQMLVQRTGSGGWALRATYKVANLVGHLGDNGAALRAAITADRLLWAIAPRLKAVNIVSHTRWASNGIINVPNCHPVDGRTRGDGDNSDARAASFVLNGDVDNYPTLVATSVQSRKLSIDPAVSTDAKILPVVFALDTDAEASLDARFQGVMRRCHGSFAIVLQHLAHPRHLLVGQKGSGQALYLGQVPDGFVVASEVYGIAALCRAYRPMNSGGELGVVVELDTGDGHRLSGHALAGGGAWNPGTESIQIFARDIFRGESPTFIEKEVGEAPASVRKTLAGKYLRDDGGHVRFLINGFGNGDLLLRRLDARDQPAVKRIIVCGQGTAAIAAMGVAHLVRRAVAPAGITVEAGKASELFGFMADGRFDDAIVVAVSQSGTTTDTNRIVDLAKARGAWVHAIVNRRNSALVQKAHSFLYTSDGRDVEMSVASTKAYYSQVTAGKLLGLLLASHLGTLAERQIAEDVDALEALPARIQAVLDRRGAIAAIAAKYAPFTRNWALVGNGANRIAAEEIRIKLSELCYKAIPCDVTEDKKHIDLSTEPMTLVVANDLPEMVVSDTVKEVSIFKAHSGKPLVLCAEGENRFDAVAEAVFPLPLVGGGLDFVVATVAGHLFGIAAAQAIDRSCTPFRHVRAILSRTDGFAKAELAEALDAAIATVETGATDSALSARLVAALARYTAWLERQPDGIAADAARLPQLQTTLNAVIDDLTRPIDTIRHQAKTVTVGISRPQSEVSPLILDALATLAVAESRIAESDRAMLEALSPLVTAIEGGVLYEVTATAADPRAPAWDIRADRALPPSQIERSRYLAPLAAEGSKRKALRTGSAVTSAGRSGNENVVVLPLAAPSGNAVSGLLLLHLGVTPNASLQQKVAVLRAIGQKYDDLTEQLAERSPQMGADRVIAAADPRTLIFADIHDILTRFGGT